MTAISTRLENRSRKLNWSKLHQDLHTQGFAQLQNVLTRDECKKLRGLYDDDTFFRSVVNMERHRFGVGSYKYFKEPLPTIVQKLRTSLYAKLVPVANEWNQHLKVNELFPDTLNGLTEMCAARGQTKPTPLLLKYSKGGYNCLHQDIYGDIAFPLQAVFLLSEVDREFTGGEFLLVEQRPRAQSVGHAISPAIGDMIIFTTRNRPVKSVRGFYRTNVRHGVSQVTSGNRCTLGIIFHNAS